MKQICTLIFVVFLGCDFLNNGIDNGYLPNPNRIYDRDTVLLRRLLDTNKVQNVNITTTFENLNGDMTISLINNGIKTLILPPLIDSFNRYITFIVRDSVDSVVIREKLLRPINIDLSGNKINNFPRALFLLANNSSLDISYNHIDTLPKEIMSFKFKHFAVDFNHICNPSDTLKNWLTTQYPNWAKYQICP